MAVIGIIAMATVSGGVIAADQSINPYTDTGGFLSVESMGSLEGTGKQKIVLDKTQPKVVLQKWNGEISFGITFSEMVASTTGSRQLLSDKVNWEAGNQKMTVFPLTAAPLMEDGGLELLIELQSKPAKNVFNFQLDNWENLDFFFQGPLWKEAGLSGPTEKCTETNCVINGDKNTRAENVVNSYAVYYKNHQDYHLGHTNYATGKAFHIFRPLITDLNGVSTWGELKYEKGVLSVIVPQKFLDTASYPIQIDPTFGYATQGASTGTIGGARSYIGSPYTALSGDIVVGYGSYVCSSASTVGATAYTFSGGVAVTRLGSANSLTGLAACGVVQLRTVSGLSDSLTAGVQYVPALGNPNGSSVTVAVDTTSGNQLDRQGTDFTLGTTWTHVDYTASKLSVFAYYATACSGTCTETFTTTGAFVGPVGVTSANVSCWGGGAGGGGATVDNRGGSGNGGGAFSSGDIPVTTGTIYTVTIGAGGAAGVTGISNGASGGDSWFSTTGTLLAKGGSGSDGSGGAGGDAASGVGTIKTSGGAGAANPGIGSNGSGGGGSGGDTTNGGNGASGSVSGGAGGTAGTTNGATGGSGGNANTVGSPGISPGSGAGGGGVASNKNGGAGAGGKCIIIYSVNSTPRFLIKGGSLILQGGSLIMK